MSNPLSDEELAELDGEVSLCESMGHDTGWTTELIRRLLDTINEHRDNEQHASGRDSSSGRSGIRRTSRR